MNIAINFDGTCVTDDYPYIGQQIGAAEALRRMVANGHQLYLRTTRRGKQYMECVKWYHDNGIQVWPGLVHGTDIDVSIDVINIGCPLIHGDHDKPYVDWVRIEELFALLDK